MQFTAATSVSTPLHAGMQDAFMDCLTLLIEDQLTASALYRVILHKLYTLWPPAYHRYYLRGPDSGEEFLPYQEWQALVDELRERLQLNQILGLAPDSRVMDIRRKLLLESDELPEPQGDPSQPESQARAGMIEGYMAVLHAIFYGKLEGEALSGYLSEQVFAATAPPVWRK
jgi:hypothetical protein